MRLSQILKSNETKTYHSRTSTVCWKFLNEMFLFVHLIIEKAFEMKHKNLISPKDEIKK